MAQSSYGTYLLKYVAGSGNVAGGYEKLVDIVDYSDLEEQPDTLDTTTLSDDTETSIPSIKRLGGGISFTLNVEPSKFLELRDIAEAHTLMEFALWFRNGVYDSAALTAFNTADAGDPTKTAYEFAVYFNGTISVVQNGAGVDEVLRATLTIYPQKNEANGKVMSYARPSTHLA